MELNMILSDLDGTLLNGAGELTDGTREALTLAAGRGILVVPATGRPFETLPPALRALPFLRYVILMNGAQVYDCVQGRVLYRRELPLEDARAILDRLEEEPVLVECFAGDGRIYLEERFYKHMERWVMVPNILAIMSRSRTVVADLRQTLGALGLPVQKIHLYSRDLALREALLERLAGAFPCAAVSCSVPGNIEITHCQATKGEAMRALCAHLGIPLDRVMAFGDERNDRTMLEYAGIGVAMGNALPEIQASADRIARPNTQDGVAHMIRDILCQTAGD